MTHINTQKIVVCLASPMTQFQLVDALENGMDGHSIQTMRITNLYYKRSVDNHDALKCINIKIDNVDDPVEYNNTYFHDGINTPSTRFFACIFNDTHIDSCVTYNNYTTWHYVDRNRTSHNIKNMLISVFDGDETTLMSDITIDNRMYIELEFY